ncbi:MAG: polyisoprenoid-binding protein [Nitrospira sp.]|nr:polyisoprenoid-binding protein [Nitrospira sp.]
MYRRMMTAGVLCAVLLAGWPAGAGAEMARWDLDLEHSIIEFRVAHMVVSKTAGRFMDYSGVVEMDAEAQQFKTIEATIKTGSVNTNHEKRDAHLRSADFFDVEKFPAMTYKMKSYKKVGEGYQAVGDLTLRGVTKEITLAGTFNGVSKDPWGNTRAGFTGEGKVNRKDFGMVWNKALDSGGFVVGEEVSIRLDTECIKAKKP